MPSNRAITVGASLGRLRSAIMICCAAVVLALATQLGVWAMLTFTDIRWTTDDAAASATPLIIRSDTPPVEPDRKAAADPAQAIRSVASTETGERTVSVSEVEEAQDARRVLSDHDATLQYVAHCAKGVGNAGMLAMLPLLMLAVLVAAGAGTAGCERLIGAFTLSIVLALLILPLGAVLSLPWEDGALTSYGLMTAQVDDHLNGPVTAYGPFIFYAQYLILPGACVVGVVLTYLRFSAAVERAILQGDALRVDPDIEAEASNVIVTAKGNRAASALNRLAEEQHARNQPQPAAAAPVPPKPPRPVAPDRPLQSSAPAAAPAAPKPDLPRRII